MEDPTPSDGNPWSDWIEYVELQGQSGTEPTYDSKLPVTETTALDHNSSGEDSEFDFALDDGRCQDCRENPGEWYCGACTQRYCERCWRRRPGHKKKNPDSARHMKVHYANHVHFEQILHPRWDDETRRGMHDGDLQSLWFWIAEGDLHNNGVRFEDLPRFGRLVADHRQKHNLETCFPRLVSFVGTTGAGKSTLIRMMLEKPWLTDRKHGADIERVPIVGKCNSTVPTSGDVHLYADMMPEEEFPDRPIFYADSEGFDGGAVAPVGSFAHIRSRGEYGTKEDLERSLFSSLVHYLTGQARTRDFRLSSAEKGGKLPTRDAMIKKLFPRLLYNFSDVVIFVVKEPRTLGERIADILNWAAASAASALNRATLPRLIVVINNADQSADWDPETTKSQFFEENKHMITGDPNIRRLRESFTARGMKVDTLEELLLMHYASIDLILVPHGHIRSRLSDQLRKLSIILQDRTRESQQSKYDAGMLLPSQDQEFFFQLAFDHFVTNIETHKPFNFLAKLLQLNPMPNNLANNLSTLFEAVYVSMDTKTKDSAVSEFLHLVAPLVCSAVAVNATRAYGRLPGKLSDVFRGGLASHDDDHPDTTYEMQVEEAIERFCDRISCQFINRSSGACSQCVLSRIGHNQGHHHQDCEGEIIGKGDFESTFVEALRAQWRDMMLKHLEIVDKSIHNLMHLLNPSGPQVSPLTRSLRPKQDAIWDVHHRNLRKLFSALPGLADKTACRLFLCFFCLQDVPAQVLPCNHAICERCVRALAHCHAFSCDNDKRLVSLKQCPLHHETKVFELAPRIQLKPCFSGVSVLTLDGGGVRGLMELKLLQAVQSELGGHIPIQRFFDLIGGTSTGGIIALGMGTQDLTVARCEDIYKGLCEEAFTKHGSAWSGNLFAYTVHGCLYQNLPFEQKLQNLLGKARLMGLYHNTPLALKNKIFITSTKEDGTRPTIFTNYIRTSNDKRKETLYDYEMVHDETLKFQSWEVARATSSAPGYFPSFTKDMSSTYWDGGLCHNNPAWIARQEIPKIWPGLRNLHPDILLSVGSGYEYEDQRPKSKSPKSKSPKSKRPKGFSNRIMSWVEDIGFFKTMSVLRANFLKNLDSEQAWKEHFSEFERSRDIAVMNRYFRLNPPCQIKLPDLDDLGAFKNGMLETTAKQYIREAELLIKTIARRLIVTSFYFEPDQPPQETENGRLFVGHIACRFLNGSQDLKHFFQILRERVIPFCFKMKETDEYLGKRVDSDSLVNMEENLAFRLEGASFLVPKALGTFTIMLQAEARGFPPSPISGCPWHIHTADRWYPS